MRGKSPKTKDATLLSEIFEQKEVLARLAAKHVDFAQARVVIRQFDFYKRHLSRVKRFLFLGCGSSANASLLGSYYFEELTKKNCEYEFADEFVSRKAIVEKGTAVFLLSQSGQSKDLVIAAEIARKKGAFIIVVTNTSGSKLDRMSDITLLTEAGAEKGIAATKSYSSQILVLLFSALYFADFFDEGIEKRKALFKELKGLPDKIGEMFKSEKKIAAVAKKFAKKKSLLVAGRKFQFPIALEGAHKAKETAYIHAEGFAAEEMRHGSEAMLEKGFPVICLMPDDGSFKDNVVLLKELKKTKADVYVVSDKDSKTLQSLSKALIRVPKASEPLQPFLFLVVLQLLAYHLAVAKKIDTAAPRNISKFVA